MRAVAWLQSRIRLVAVQDSPGRRSAKDAGEIPREKHATAFFGKLQRLFGLPGFADVLHVDDEVAGTGFGVPHQGGADAHRYQVALLIDIALLVSYRVVRLGQGSME